MKGKAKAEQEQQSQAASSYLAYAALRDVGRKKAQNEDNVFALTSLVPSQTGEGADLPFGLFIVADGVSGQADGAQASAYASRYVACTVTEQLLLPMLGGDRASIEGTPGDVLSEAVRQANEGLYQRNSSDGKQPSATTLTAALVLGRRLYLAHVGDSRAYLLQDGELKQLTDDHSLVARLVELGQLSADEAAHSEQRSSLYRAVGSAATLEVDSYSNGLSEAHRLLLCSDGLWGMVDESEIAELLAQSPMQAATQLVAAANANGGEDNISVVVIALE